MRFDWINVRWNWRWLFTPPVQHISRHAMGCAWYLRVGPVAVTRFLSCTCKEH